MKTNRFVYAAFISLSLLTITIGCKKDPPKVTPSLTTTVATNIASTTATSGGTITNDGNSPITSRGVCWGTNLSPTIDDSKTNDGTGIGTFISTITGLSPGRTYYARAFATNSIGTAYGQQITIITISVLPILTTSDLLGVSSTSATGGGNISSDGGSAIIARGVCWSRKAFPTADRVDSTTINGYGIGVFTSSITGLKPGTSYYIRAYATNSIGTAYGNQVTTTTISVLPEVSTIPVATVSATMMVLGGNVTSDGGSAVTAKGACWSTNQNPTVADNKVINGIGTGYFNSAITELTPGTTYYIRAYGTNSVGTGYGNQVVSTTLAILPTITTTAVTAITDATATSGGYISFDGGSSVTARGVCWSISQTPTISDNKTINGMGSSSFVSSLTGLSPGTTYYIRAYATNSMGTAYGDQLSATTLAVVPTITTLAVSPTTETTATGGGSITSDGGSPVTVKGVCWSNNPTPTILNIRTLDGTGTGSFVSVLTGLTTNTIYYVRSYATNSVGTSYGSEIRVTQYLNSPGPNVSDVDGNLYHSVKIGSQIWTVENLKATKYRNGNLIGTTTPATLDITAETTPKFQWAYDGNESNVATYGRLYTWHAVTDIRNVCPTGWHVPSDAEWTTLSNFLGGESVAGGKLKETGTIHWNTPNTSATNSSGFTALAGGDRYDFLGNFSLVSSDGAWWSSTESDSFYAWGRRIRYIESSVARGYYGKAYGFSVRCVKD